MWPTEVQFSQPQAIQQCSGEEAKQGSLPFYGTLISRPYCWVAKQADGGLFCLCVMPEAIYQAPDVALEAVCQWQASYWPVFEGCALLQMKLKLSKEQNRVLLEARSLYLLSIGFHSASLARLQSQMMVKFTHCNIPRLHLDTTRPPLIMHLFATIHHHEVEVDCDCILGCRVLAPVAVSRMAPTVDDVIAMQDGRANESLDSRTSFN